MSQLVVPINAAHSWGVSGFKTATIVWKSDIKCSLLRLLSCCILCALAQGTCRQIQAMHAAGIDSFEWARKHLIHSTLATK